MLRAHLKTLRGQPPHAPLFRSPRGTRVSYDALHYQWGQVCAAAGRVDAQGKPRYTLSGFDDKLTDPVLSYLITTSITAVSLAPPKLHGH
jgi:hypothetical protein